MESWRRMKAFGSLPVTLLGLCCLLAPGAPSAQPMDREAALAASPRITFKSPKVRGSIALKGGKIDDLTLVRYRETVDPNSAPVTLLSPIGSPRPYYAEFGWSGAAGSNPTVPGPNTESVSLHPYALISRHATSTTSGSYLSHEGLIGVLGDMGLHEVSYPSIDEKRHESFNITNGWLGIADRYWATALLPNTDVRMQANFRRNEDAYQADYLLDPQTILPGGTGSADARIFAGAKEVLVVDGYNAVLQLNRFDLLIDWGSFSFIVKPMFLAIDFFFHIFRITALPSFSLCS